MSLLIVLKKLWRWLQSLWRHWWMKPMVVAVVTELAIWSDAKYESFFFELLKGVGGQGWDRDAVLAHLAKREGDGRLILWLRRFGADRLADNKRHGELAERMGRLGDVDGGEFCQEVKRIAGELLDKPEVPASNVSILLQSKMKTEINTNLINPLVDVVEESKIESHEKQEGWKIQGAALLQEERYEEAIALYEQALEFDPENHQIWYQLGNAVLRLGQYDEANKYWKVATCIESLKWNPEDFEAWCKRGFALSELGRHEKAITSFDRALTIKPDDHELSHIRELTLSVLKKEAIEIASYSSDGVLSINPLYESWYVRGIFSYKLGRFEEAIVCYDYALSINPDDIESWNDRGVALHKLGRYEEALISYDHALSINIDYLKAWVSRGNTLNNLGKYEEAITSYDRGLSINPYDYLAWVNRGGSLYNLRRYEEAIVSNDCALSINLDYIQAWVGRGIAAINSLQPESNIALFLPKELDQRAIGSSGIERALVSCDAGIAYCDSQSLKHIEVRVKLHQIKGNIYFNKGKGTPDYRTQYANAIKSYEAALKECQGKNECQVIYKYQFGEEYLEILLSLIQIHTALGNTELAQTLCREGTELYQRLLEIIGKEKFVRRFDSSFRDLTISAYVQAGQLIDALEAAETDKNQCLAWMFADNEIPIVNYGSMQELLDPKTAIIFWHISDYALTTFLLLPNATTPLGFSAFPVNGEPEFETWQRQWQTDYQTEVIEDSTANFPQWITGMTSRCDQLRQLLNIDTIQTELDKYPEINQLLLVPHRTLHLYPLHSLFDRKYLITHVPSLQIALELKQRQPPQPTTSRQLLAIANPKHQIKTTDTTNELEITKKVKNLRFAEAEGKAICQAIPNSQLLTGETATLERLTQELSDHPTQILHFSCHGKHDPEKPERSQLYLSQNDTLTFKQIPTLPLTTCQLAYLSACETGMTANKTIRNEYIGLSSAFLYAGVPVIVSTLWSIEDVASALLSIAFYDRYLHPTTGCHAPLALKQAQAWLRDFDRQEYERIYADSQWRKCLTQNRWDEVEVALNQDKKPYRSPYYWAGYYTVSFFTNTGD